MAAVTVIKNTDYATIERMLLSFERSSTLATNAQMLTRFATERGISEAQEIMSLACRYADINKVMPVSVAKWEMNWFIKLLPTDSLRKVADAMQDCWNCFLLKEASEFDPANPVSVIDAGQGAGLRHGLFDLMRHNIEPYTSTSSGGDAPGAPAVLGTVGTIIGGVAIGAGLTALIAALASMTSEAPAEAQKLLENAQTNVNEAVTGSGVGGTTVPAY